MVGATKGFSKFVVLLAVVTLLSYSSLTSSFILPHVSHTDDAIIVDFDGVGNAPFHHSKNVHDEIINPGFIVRVPSSFSPYPVLQRLPFFSWRTYSNGHPSLVAPGNVPSTRESGEPDWQLTVKQASQCGRGPATMPSTRLGITEKIAGGTNTKKNVWPFVVALKKADGIFCAGTLISDTKVLTAAQCLEKMSSTDVLSVTVLIGLYASDLSDIQMTRRISKVILHSKYNGITYANDIAVITLDAPVVLSRAVAPVCLPTANTDINSYLDQDAIILGWGGTDAVGAGLAQAPVAPATPGLGLAPVAPPPVAPAAPVAPATPGLGLAPVAPAPVAPTPVAPAPVAPAPVAPAPVAPVGVAAPTPAPTPATTPAPVSSGGYEGINFGMGGVIVISGKNTPPATFRAAVNPFLQQAKVSISANDECRVDPVIGKYVIDTNICVSTPGKFTCTGDVGGPVVVLSSTGTWTLIGINSYTKDCASMGLKTRVSAYVSWINLYLN